MWAKHCAEEIGNWAAFLPQLYGLYRVVDRPEHNPYADLRRCGTAAVVRYRNLGPMTNPLHGWQVDRAAISFVGRDLQRPECILAEADGTLWTADARGGVVRIAPGRDAGARRTAGRHGVRGLRLGRSLHARENASERTRVRTERRPRDRGLRPGRDRPHDADRRRRASCSRIGRAPLGKTNFVLADSRGRVWFTVTTRSTRGHARSTRRRRTGTWA